jgi:putative ATP-dependent endonuclease of OLD family
VWIQTLWIDGYRHFVEQTIEFEKKTTIVAGANNSGKTSVIDLLRVILRGDRTFGPDDFAADQRLLWSKRFIEAAISGEDEFAAFMSSGDTASGAPFVKVRIRVDYDAEKDDIREFAELLMDLDSTKSSFFFQYVTQPTPSAVAAAYGGLYERIAQVALKAGWSKNAPVPVDSTEFRALQAVLDDALVRSCRTTVSFADELYENIVPMDRSRFASLFNFNSIKASRSLDDTIEDRSGALNRRLVDVAKEGPEWAATLAAFPSQVLEAIENTGIRHVTSKETLKSLNTVIESISLTNGSSKSDLLVDFLITEDHAIQLIARAMQTRYTGSGLALGEGSQGLGYSNLILLHLETESFARSAATAANSLIVNLLVVEEPESHMHPQMQNAFIKHLFQRVEAIGAFQAVVTTHSNEIVRSSGIEMLRVLKRSDKGCRVVDLRKFHEKQVKGKSAEQQRLFSFLYAINFSDVLFADKVVMYEGDTERMYLQALVQEREDLSALRAQYVSFVQVGGAYAHIYMPLIVDALQTKTVIITDLDYEKGSDKESLAALNPLPTTNATLNALLAPRDMEDPKVASLEELYAKVDEEDGLAHIQDQPLLAIAFQTRYEGHARTLEEALLATYLKEPVWTRMERAKWTAFRSTSELRFSIPSKNDRPSIREVVASSANSKTDFMYSLLLKKDFETGVPPYILAALKWLNK